MAVLFLSCSHAWSAEARSGILREVVADDFAAGEARTHYTLETDEGAVQVVPLEQPAATSGDSVKVVGRMEDGKLVGYVQTLKETQPTSALGVYTTAVVLMKLTSSTPESMSRQTAKELVFSGPTSANAFYKEESYNQISLIGRQSQSGDVFGWYTLNASTSGCDTGTWKALADQKVEHEGISLDEYERVIYVVAGAGGLCTWNGEASDNEIFVNGDFLVTQTTSKTYTHELGHTFGLGHAGGIVCRNHSSELVSLSGNCEIQTYKDPFDTMGNIANRHHNGRNLTTLGILTPSNIEVVTEPGVYSLKAALSQSSQPNLLRVPKLRNSKEEVIEWYDLEIRQRGGAFENVEDASMTGVSIRLSGASGRIDGTLLVNTTPGETGFKNAPLAIGKTFKYQEVTIQTLTAANGEATVYIDPGPPRDEIAPTTPSGLHRTENPNGVELEWEPASDNLEVVRYRVFRDGTEVGTTTETTFVDAPASGPHTYGVYAEDEAGNRSLEPAALEVEASDAIAPTQPGTPSVLVQRDSVIINWKASSDNFAVAAYRVFRDGVQIGVLTPDKFSSPQLTEIPRPPTGTYLYEVYAEDPSGNVSPSSSATVAVWDATPPSPPGDVAASVAADGVHVTWTASSDDVGVVRYRVLRDGSEVGNSTTTGFTDTPRPGTHYYLVIAEDAVGNRASSSVVIVKIADETPPSPPGDVTATVAADGVHLTWTASSDDAGVARYRIRRDGSEVGVSTTPSFTDTPPLGTYHYEIIAEDAAGNRANSSVVTVTVTDKTPPSPPGDLAATVSADGVHLTWTASSDDVGVVRYRILRDASEIGVSTTPGFTDTPPPGSGAHLYEVLAQDAAGNYTESSLLVVIPEARRSDPPAPGGGEAAPSGVPAGPAASSEIKLTLKVEGRSKRKVLLVAHARGETIARLEIRIDGVLLESNAGSSLSASWTVPRCGVHTVVARAIGAESRKAVRRVVRIGHRCGHRG